MMVWSGVGYCDVLTAPIHCRGFIGRSENSSEEQTNLHLDELAGEKTEQMFIFGWTIPLMIHYIAKSIVYFSNFQEYKS